MQTVEWTDGKLEERLERIDERFGETNRRIKEGQEETARRFDEVDRRIKEGREETARRFDEVDRRANWVGEEVRELKQEMKALHTTFQRGNFALVVAVFGVLVATILKGG
jgi:chromosome segregation ATPase